MASITLPNIVTGKTITVEAPNLAAAQQAAATATGVSLAAQQGGGTYGTNSFTGGPSGGGGGDGGGGGVATPQVQQGFNVEAANAAAQLANNAAQQEYLRARLNLDTDIEANRKAQQVWQNTFDQAKFEYQKTIDTQQFGISEGNLTGTYKGAPTLAAQSEQNKTALGYLGLVGNLRGPNDPFQYLRTLQGTPNGIADIVNAAAGRYQLSTVPSGEISQRATIAGQLANMNAVQQTGSLPAATGVLTPAAGIVTGAKGVGGTGGVPMADVVANAATGIPDLSGLPNAGQIAPQQYALMNPSQKAALWASYEYGGPQGAMRPEDAQADYLRSLPKYTYGGGKGKVNLLTV